MTRPYVFGTNFKMNQTPAESATFYQDLAARIHPRAGVQCFVIPPFTSLAAIAGIAGGDGGDIWIGAQNMHWASDGAYTGEISASFLLALAVDLVLLGHAERRAYFHETDAELNRKVLAAVGVGLRVILAVGETASERGYGVSEETIARQLKIGLHDVPPEQAALVHIAYEPVWSIGEGGTPASADDVAPIAALIRGTLGDLIGDAGTEIPVLYGGSVTPANAGAFTALSDIDGLFVGRAAWTVDGYIATYEAGLAERASAIRPG